MIIITAPVHQTFLSHLQEKELPFLYLPHIQNKDLISIVDKATGLIVSTQIRVDKTLLDQAPELKWIGRLGSGMEHIDVAYAQSRNINCVSSPEGNSNAVAEHVLGILLNLLRNIGKSTAEVRAMQWLREENRGTEISGKTFGIIGYGNTGSRLAKLLSSFEVEILAHDKYLSGFSNSVVKETDIESILGKCDFISLHLPLNAETKHYANLEFFQKMKRKPVFINSSRGGVTNTQSLITALKEGFLSGAVLDVLENEKPETLNTEEKEQYHFLSHHPNVVLTPHIAGYTHEAFYKMGMVLLEKLELI
jgi:D-3-phosphoglycerate dehydrogenase